MFAHCNVYTVCYGTSPPETLRPTLNTSRGQSIKLQPVLDAPAGQLKECWPNNGPFFVITFATDAKPQKQ